MLEHKVPIEVSARHIHLSPEHLEVLFGGGAQLHTLRNISQPGQFAAEEKITVVGPKGQLSVRVVGPVREQTQVELAVSECRLLGIEPVLRVSGSLQGTSAVTLVGPAGKVELTQGVIVAQRHLHINPREAAEWGLRHGNIISIKTTGLRPVTFHDVYVVSREKIDELSFMIDVDEANAAGLKGGEMAVIQT